MGNKIRRLGLESLESRKLMAAMDAVGTVDSATAEVSMPSVTADHQAEFTAPLQITGASGMRAAEVRIQYDPDQLSTSAEQIAAGSVWQGQAAVVANVDEQAGTIVAFVFSANEVQQSAGSLMDISFVAGQLPARHQHGHRSPITIDVQEVRLNEGQIELAVSPVVGPDATDGTVGFAEPTHRHSWSHRQHGHPRSMHHWQHRWMDCPDAQHMEPNVNSVIVNSPNLGLPIVNSPIVNAPIVDSPTVNLPTVNLAISQSPTTSLSNVNLPTESVPTALPPVVGSDIVAGPPVPDAVDQVMRTVGSARQRNFFQRWT